MTTSSWMFQQLRADLRRVVQKQQWIEKQLARKSLKPAARAKLESALEKAGQAVALRRSALAKRMKAAVEGADTSKAN